MSNKKELLVVGVLSATLFTGFTIYSHAAGNRHEVVNKKTEAAAPQQMAQPASSNRTAASVQVSNEAPAEQTIPAASSRNKNTKTKAS
jgi:hypothetical protein